MVDNETRKKLYLNAYFDNQAFIEKAVFTVSIAAIPFLLNYSEKVCEDLLPFFGFCIGLFLLTFVIQLSSAYTARECSDLSQNENLENSDKAKCEFLDLYTRILNDLFLVLFCFSIICTSIFVLVNTVYKN